MKSIKELYKVGYGLSSRHTVGSSRADKIFKKNFPEAKNVKITFYGRLASTGKGHETDKAVINSLKDVNVQITWKPDEELPYHPKAMLFETENEEKWEVYSIGGGDLYDNEKLIKASLNIYKLKSMNEILLWCDKKGMNIWEYVEFVEGKEIWDFLAEIWQIMKSTIKNGLEAEGVLPGPLHVSRKALTYYTKAQVSSGGIKDKGTIFSSALSIKVLYFFNKSSVRNESK